MLLQCEHIMRKYSRSDHNFFTAVHKTDFSISKGDFVSLIGKSGSGKSTLLNMIAGLLRPTGGKVLLEGKDIWAQPEAQMALTRNTCIGYVPQGMSLLNNLTVFDNVRLPYFLQKRDGNADSYANFLLEKIGLSGKGGSYPCELSGGEMKRVAIARALVNRPLLLLADEPTADIDEETTRSVMELFRDICIGGTTILMATHELENVAYCNRVLRISNGNLTEGQISDYKKRAFLSTKFFSSINPVPQEED